MKVLEYMAFIIVFMIAHAGCTPMTKSAFYRPMTEIKSVKKPTDFEDGDEVDYFTGTRKYSRLTGITTEGGAKFLYEDEGRLFYEVPFTAVDETDVLIDKWGDAHPTSY
ncbi:hypothetical protein C6495_04425 [Candidatus Poribacteria bacterium]|nr:MAG: hypothetical protein C6495_04425 [Candidatus Poribacteria bacterium]